MLKKYLVKALLKSNKKGDIYVKHKEITSLRTKIMTIRFENIYINNENETQEIYNTNNQIRFD